MKRMIAVAIATLAIVAFAAVGAQAGNVPKTTGSVLLSDPTQFVSFDAFQSDPVKGTVSYTNFGFAVTGTGVWVPDAFNMGFAVDPSASIAATYAMSVTSFTPTSPTSVTFAGNGDSGIGWISTFTGTISGSHFTLSMTEINASDPSETYALSAHGTIASDGSLTGTWTDNYAPVTYPTGRTGTFTIGDIGHEVFHYVASVLTTSVSPSLPHASYTYQIPAGVYAPLDNYPITVAVHDGGSPGAGNDTISFNGSGYAIVGGNLTVFH